MAFRERTLREIANMICGNYEEAESFFVYRTGGKLTEFFHDCDTDYSHDGSTRSSWVFNVLKDILTKPKSNVNVLPDTFLRVIRNLMDQSDAYNENSERSGALTLLNTALNREGFEAFYADNKQCYIRHLATNTIAKAMPNPHRPFTELEAKKREQLIAYLDKISEDELIEDILLPLFRQLGFHRVSATGHEDKALEYGKDIWMRYTLPTQHILYFGIQAKKGKLDSSGATRGSNANIAEIHNQVTMMLGHEIFDPEINRRVLVDHAFIIAGGEITKAAKNWIGNKLDATRRSQIMFMDRDDILNLFIVTNLPLPTSALSIATEDRQIPF